VRVGILWLVTEDDRSGKVIAMSPDLLFGHQRSHVTLGTSSGP